MGLRGAGGLLVVLLLMAAALATFAVVPAHGSTGSPTLGVTDTYSTQPSGFTPATSYVNVTAGSDTARADGTTSGYFAIDFGTFGGSQLVTFSGTQFDLYLSRDGYSQISQGDIKYSGPTSFSVNDLTTNSGWHQVNEANGTFYVGQTSGGTEVVTGPVALQASAAYKYVKVFDGSKSSLAVATPKVSLSPAIKVTPASGSPGETVTVIGGGFHANSLIDLAYSFTGYPWSGTPVAMGGAWVSGLSTGNGSFARSFPMVDTRQVYNPSSGIVTSVPITIQVFPHSGSTLMATAGFDEGSRTLTSVVSRDPTGSLLDTSNAGPTPRGNDTSSVGGNLIQPVSIEVGGTLSIAGKDWMASSAVTFTIGGIQVESSSTNSSGYFDATVTVPDVPGVVETVQVANHGVTYQFEAVMRPTLVLTPGSGPVGTKVGVQVHGLTANGMWYVYWHEKSYSDSTWYQVAHGTTGPDGSFNETVSFNVPVAYGGSHSLSVSSTNVSTSSPSSPPGTLVTQTLVVTSASTTTSTSTTASSTTTRSSSTTAATSTTTSTGTSTASTTQTGSTTTSGGPSVPEVTYVYVAIIAAVVVVAALAAFVLGRKPRRGVPPPGRQPAVQSIRLRS